MTENQKLREAAYQAVEAMQLFAVQYPHMQKGYMVDALEALTQALALPTAAQVGEREAFEEWANDNAIRTDLGAWEAWQARAALSAGDALLAEREACAKLCEEVADDLITAMRKEGETDDEVMTSLVASARVCAEEIRGGYSKKFNPHNAAIDAAMRKDKP